MKVLHPLAGMLLVLSGSAYAEDNPRARLVYSRLAGAERCPEEETLRNAVSARLGYQPFDSSAPTIITATVRATSTGLEAHLEIKGKGSRRLVSVDRNCEELASAMALAISIAIDPLSLTRVPPEPAPAPAPAQVQAPAPVAPPQPPAPLQAPVQEAPPAQPSSWPKFSASAGALVSVASAPSPAPGFVLGGRAQWTSFSIGLEARVDLPSSGSSVEGRFSTSLLTASAVPCFHRGFFGACAVVTGGALRASGDGLVNAQQVTLPWFALGARVQAELALGSSFFLQANVEAAAPLARVALLIGETQVWASSPVCGSLGVRGGLVF